MMAQRLDYKGLLLGDLLHGIVDLGEYARLLVTGVSQDSREVQPGTLFFALSGQATHGMEHLSQAIQEGAVAVLVQPGGEWDRARLADQVGRCPVPLILISDLSQKVGRIAARFFGCPAQAMRVVGVTGTNGKTTVTHFLASALAARIPAGVIGTLGNGIVGNLKTATHTTPDAVSVQAELSRQQRLGVKAVAMEVSSHALDQGRVAGLPFHTAVFTNLSRDHQDYHGSMQAYAEAKARLLHRQGLMLAVINADDPVGAQLIADVSRRVVVVAVGTKENVKTQADNFVQATGLKVTAQGMHIEFDSSWGEGEFHSRLLGRFNAENLLLTLAVLLGWDMPMQAALKSLQALRPVDGRMVHLGGQGKPHVVVDFAHTPDALEKVLLSLRDHVTGKLICVFGCGGDRDRGKRPQMGEIANRLSDGVVLTDDNPRSEDGQLIIDDIIAGMPSSESVWVMRDRAQAIAQTVANLNADDLVLVAGKGHEAFQQVGDLKLPFNDAEHVAKALTEYEA